MALKLNQPTGFSGIQQHKLSPTINSDQEPFRPIHYLGSKFRLLQFINDAIDDIDPSMSRVCDLFSGSGSVSVKLSRSRPITAIDIQEYSRVICSAVLNPKSKSSEIEQIVTTSLKSEHAKKIRSAVSPLCEYEKYCMDKAPTDEGAKLADLLENGSIVTYQTHKQSFQGHIELRSCLNEVLKRLKKYDLDNTPQTLFIRHAGGIYFSYQQTIQIDSLLEVIHAAKNLKRDSYLAPLISAVSYCVNTVGKQFAQPIKPRNANGDPKAHLYKSVSKDREIDLTTAYKRWAKKYIDLPASRNGSSAARLDYRQALRQLPNDTKIIYADPPYTRDHYSRYYHLLETLCLRDNPQISTVVTQGKTQISRGIYRADRHQSPFCIKSQAPKAFKDLVELSRLTNASLVLSYSPFDTSKNSHPRLLTIDQILTIAKESYGSVVCTSAGSFTHSKLTNAEKHLEASDEAEILIICRP